MRGIRPIGDALSHTNPTSAYGASMALRQGFSLGKRLGDHADPLKVSEAFEAAHGPDLVARFEAVSAEDIDRRRWWSGESIDPTDPNQSMALALRFVVYPAASRDPDICRAVARRIGALDPVDALSAHAEPIERALTIRRQTLVYSPAAPPPSRVELAAALQLTPEPRWAWRRRLLTCVGFGADGVASARRRSGLATCSASSGPNRSTRTTNRSGRARERRPGD